MPIHHPGYYSYARGLYMVDQHELQLHVFGIAGIMQCHFGADHLGADQGWVVQDHLMKNRDRDSK